MEWTELGIEGAWVITPKVFEDERGSFRELFRGNLFEENAGHPFTLKQANMSVSKVGVVRGIHFASVPPSQAKYVMCISGSVLDVVVDLRVGSPTFGKWEGVLLDSRKQNFVYISEGLGHGFCALEDDSVVTYLCSTSYDPGREHEVAAFDPAIGIDWPTTDRNGDPMELIMSAKDMAAPTLTAAVDLGILPTYDAAVAYRRSLGEPQN